MRARIGRVLAERQERTRLLFIRAIAMARAEAAITLAGMAFDMGRWCRLAFPSDSRNHMFQCEICGHPSTLRLVNLAAGRPGAGGKNGAADQ